MKKETTLSVLKEIRDLLSKPKTPLITGSSSKLDYKIETQQEYWTITVPEGATIEGALAECKKLFPIWRWTDKNLDEIIKSDRTSEKEYSIKVKANIESDEDLKNLSADNLKEKGVIGVTLLERILLELDYFKKTGEHLDLKNWTLCSGSRYSDGRVPVARWYDDGFYVDWCYSDSRYSDLRSRAVILSP